jgi:hypothetical protein
MPKIELGQRPDFTIASMRTVLERIGPSLDALIERHPTRDACLVVRRTRGAVAVRLNKSSGAASISLGEHILARTWVTVIPAALIPFFLTARFATGPLLGADLGIFASTVVGVLVFWVFGGENRKLQNELLRALQQSPEVHGGSARQQASATSDRVRSASTEEAPKRDCAACGAHLERDFSRCTRCGASALVPEEPGTRPDRHAEPSSTAVASAIRPCGNCGSPVEPGFTRCPDCGAQTNRVVLGPTLSDFDEGATLNNPRPIDSAQIIVVRPNGAATYPLRAVTRIGRQREGNDIVLSDRDVSRLHGAVQYEDGLFFYEDIRSLNGTWLVRSGATTRVTARIALADGDSLVIGASRLVFRGAEMKL